MGEIADYYIDKMAFPDYRKIRRERQNMAYDNTNKGVLFINDRKQKDSHPDFKGSLDVGGVSYWLSGWRKTTSKGETISVSIEAKDANPVMTQPTAKSDGHAEVKAAGVIMPEEISDDIPW